MTNNKIPLALGYDPSTGNASGLEEFTLNLSDVGDTCTNVPGTGQALVYNSEGNWCPSTLPAPGSFTGNLSDVGEVCDNQPTPGQALVWSGNVWCPSTISTGGGGGGSNVPDPASVGQLVQSTNDTSWGVIGSATFITNSNIITTADGTLGAYLPRVGGVDKNSLVITTNASAVSSLSGASGSIVYFEGTTPLAPSLKTFAQILSNENYNIAAGITYANDSTVVKTTGDQTVAGVKTFTSNPILQGIPANSVLFTNDTSSVSSTSGASGSIVYFEGTNPAPALQPITTILQNAAVRVEDKNLRDLANVSIIPENLGDGDTLEYRTGLWRRVPSGDIDFAGQSVSAVSGSYTVSNVVTVPPGYTGKGDGTVDSFIIFSGTDASSTEYVGTRWGANWVEGPQNIATTNGNYFAYVSAAPTGDAPGSSGVAAVALNANALQFIENGSATTATFAALTVNGTAPSSTIAPTLAGHLTTKTYVDSVAGAPKTFLAIGTSTASIANTTVDLTWATPEISDSDITLSSNELTFAVAGTYSIDLSARTSGDNRVELFLRTFKDTGSGHVELTDHTAANYMSRDTDQNTGSVVLSTMFTLAAGDKLKFQCTGNTDGTGALTTAGTILKILGWT